MPLCFTMLTPPQTVEPSTPPRSAAILACPPAPFKKARPAPRRPPTIDWDNTSDEEEDEKVPLEEDDSSSSDDDAPDFDLDAAFLADYRSLDPQLVSPYLRPLLAHLQDPATRPDEYPDLVDELVERETAEHHTIMTAPSRSPALEAYRDTFAPLGDLDLDADPRYYFCLWTDRRHRLRDL